MASDLGFLQPIGSTSNPNPNFAQATGNISFSNYNQSPSAVLNSVQANILVAGGVAVGIAQAQSTFDSGFSDLFTNTIGAGVDGAYQVSANSAINVIASFNVAARDTFSFNFAADLALIAKEIDDPRAEYNQAKGKTAFLVLDITDVNKPIVLDYFGLSGNLKSAQQVGDIKFNRSGRVRIDNRDKTLDINGNNSTDSAIGNVCGTYERRFLQNKNIAIVEINETATNVVGDTLIGNLGNDVTYGTIWNDNLIGSDCADKIYGSLGDDRIQGRGGDDILEGGQGDDTLNGGLGNDKLYGGSGNDVLIGGRGSDVLVGGDGSDTFVFQKADSFFGDCDVIKDFEVGIDKIQFLGCTNIAQIVDIDNSTLLTTNAGGKVLIEGLNINQLSASDFKFA